MTVYLDPKSGATIGYRETKGTTAEPFIVPMAWQAATLSYVSLNVDASGNLLTSGGGGGGGSVTQGTTPWVTNTLDETSRIDSGTPPYVYTGSAAPGTSEGAAAWKITRTDTTGPIKVLYASGSASYTNIWTNRASLSYS